ncbi:hypothetical protein OTU49_005545 [Cherax quadricarinatus]|uniref:Uncharacterized protein n=1 Tax=Cherax quadricarinatus TaxID=27406 RepID=A0AAW0WTD4_CHEQU
MNPADDREKDALLKKDEKQKPSRGHRKQMWDINKEDDEEEEEEEEEEERKKKQNRIILDMQRKRSSGCARVTAGYKTQKMELQRCRIIKQARDKTCEIVKKETWEKSERKLNNNR